MPHKIPPKSGFVESLVRLSWKGKNRWRSQDGKRIYTWDSLHGEFEVFDERGWHLGALDATTGQFIKLPVKGRWIDV